MNAIVKKMMAVKDNRNIILDAMKGIGIILVVWGHVPSQGVVNHFGGFKMHLFMIISGYLAYNNKRDNNWMWIRSKVKRLLIPFVIWMIIQMYSIYQFEYKQCLDFVIRVIKSPDASNWFLFTLFEMCVLLCVCNLLISSLKIEKYDGIIYLICVGMFNLLFWKVHFQMFGTYLLSLYLLSFLLGYYIHKHGLTEKYQMILENRWVWILVSVVSVPLFLRFDPDKFTEVVYMHLPFTFARTSFCASIRIVIPLLGVYFTYIFVRILPNKVKELIGFIGKYSLEIYVLSSYFIKQYRANPWINSILNTIIAVLVSLLIAIVFENGLVNLLIFGKDNKA